MSRCEAFAIATDRGSIFSINALHLLHPCIGQSLINLVSYEMKTVSKNSERCNLKVVN